MKRTEGLPEYTFYDGPPFATGLPHYGHIAAGTIKVKIYFQMALTMILINYHYETSIMV